MGSERNDEQGLKMGVTILELLLVVALLSIVASMTYPLFTNSVRQSHLSSAAWTVATALEQARSRGLMDLVVPIATFTKGSGHYEIGSQSYILDNDCLVSWPSGNVQKFLEFDTLGQLKNESLPQELTIYAPQIGGIATVTIATYGLITWVAGQ